MGKNVGFFGGSFDPIHFGHLNLVIEMQEIYGLDEIWLCPARLNPHKKSEGISAKHRLQMLKLAIEPLPGFRVIDIELKRAGPSYTVDTLKELIAKESKKRRPANINLILGDDILSSFSHWRNPEEIVKLVPLLVGSRYLTELPQLLDCSPTVAAAIEKGLTPTRVLEISSTEIRERAAEGKTIYHLVPAKVMDYIYANQIYSTS